MIHKGGKQNMFLNEILSALASGLWRLKEPIVILIMIYAANKLADSKAGNDSKSTVETTVQAFSLPIALILFVVTTSQIIIELNLNSNPLILNLYGLRYDVYYLLLSFAFGSLIVALYAKIKTRKKSVA